VRDLWRRGKGVPCENKGGIDVPDGDTSCGRGYNAKTAFRTAGLRVVCVPTYRRQKTPIAATGIPLYLRTARTACNYRSAPHYGTRRNNTMLGIFRATGLLKQTAFVRTLTLAYLP